MITLKSYMHSYFNFHHSKIFFNSQQNNILIIGKGVPNPYNNNKKKQITVSICKDIPPNDYTIFMRQKRHHKCSTIAIMYSKTKYSTNSVK